MDGGAINPGRENMDTSVFYAKRELNQFDALKVDVSDIYQRFPLGRRVQENAQVGANPMDAKFLSLYKTTLLPLQTKNYLWHLLRRSHLDWSWFQNFRSYWTTVLGGRPLWGPEDFYFLRGIYRMRHQENQVPDTEDPSVHLEAWQRPELLFQLFHQVYFESTRNLLRHFTLLHSKLPGWNFNSMLEYGCATAPTTSTYLEFFGSASRKQLYIADIKTLAFHYASYRFQPFKNVNPILLNAENRFRLDLKTNIDLIFCITVFEHLNEPMETMTRFDSLLPKGGVLVFDYHKGDGDGLDTIQGVRERDQVLDFIAQHYTVIHGQLTKEAGMDLTIVQKK
jgi:hypothetical protein